MKWVGELQGSEGTDVWMHFLLVTHRTVELHAAALNIRGIRDLFLVMGGKQRNLKKGYPVGDYHFPI